MSYISVKYPWKNMLIKINFIESSPKLKTCFENKLVLLNGIPGLVGAKRKSKKYINSKMSQSQEIYTSPWSDFIMKNGVWDKAGCLSSFHLEICRHRRLFIYFNC